MNAPLPISINPFAREHVNIAYELAQANMPYAWSKQSFNDCLKSDYHAWIISQGGHNLANEVMGFIVVLIQVGECQLLNLCVRKKCRRQAFGNKLLQHAMDFAKQQSCKRILLEVRASNQAAISFYEKMQFNHVGVRRDYYRTDQGREDAMLFSLTLR